MFPTLIDAGLHLLAVMFTYFFFGEFAAKAYVAFAVLNLLILWFMYGEFVEWFKEVPIWCWNFATNLVLLLAIIPLSIDFVQQKIVTLSSELRFAEEILSGPPNFDRWYRLEGVCSLGCSEQAFSQKITAIEQSLKIYDAYLMSLWWDTLPFAWCFFLISLLASIYIAVMNKS